SGVPSGGTTSSRGAANGVRSSGLSVPPMAAALPSVIAARHAAAAMPRLLTSRAYCRNRAAQGGRATRALPDVIHDGPTIVLPEPPTAHCVTEGRSDTASGAAVLDQRHLVVEQFTKPAIPFSPAPGLRDR